MFAFSCEVDQKVKPSETVDLKTEMLRKKLITKTTQEIRSDFQSLTYEEGRQLWHDRLIMESKFYSGEKKELLLKIAREQMNEGYDAQPTKDIFIKVFGIEDAKRILTTLYLPNESEYISRYEVSAKEDMQECECTYVSDWCDFLYNSNVDPDDFWVCDLSACAGTAFGCGTLFLYSCNGMCKDIGEES